MSSRAPFRDVTPHALESAHLPIDGAEIVPLPSRAAVESSEWTAAVHDQNRSSAPSDTTLIHARFFYPYLPIDPSYNPSTIYNGRTPSSHYSVPPLVNLSAFFIAVCAAAINRGGGNHYQGRQIVSTIGHSSAVLSWEQDSQLGGHVISVDMVQGSFHDADAHFDHLARETGPPLDKESLKDLAVRTLARVVAMHQIGPQQKVSADGVWEDVELLNAEQLEKIGRVVGGLTDKEDFENEVTGVMRALTEYHAT